MRTLRFEPSVYNAIRAHGERAYPYECCGALLGAKDAQGWRVTASIETDNACAGSPRSRYRISPIELIKIERSARDRGLDLAGFYHSHPNHPAQWSETDLKEAHWLGCSYVITAVEKGSATITNSFELVGECEESKRFEVEKILLAEEK